MVVLTECLLLFLQIIKVLLCLSFALVATVMWSDNYCLDPDDLITAMDRQLI